MTVFLLGDEPFFPDPALAEPDGLLAVGGDLSLERLVSAYCRGIFPWYGEDTPILWWSPDPRPLLTPQGVHVSRSLRRCLNREPFTVTFDHAFERVLAGCAKTPRPQGEGTWLVSDMIEAYCHLHDLGLAHSVEAWCGGELVGGLYGVSLGRAFFGESMFHLEPNASKACFVRLCRLLAAWDFDFIDCQQTTPHMTAFGATEVPREEFMEKLGAALEGPTRRGSWSRQASLYC
ncbi:leucyl/phenylalanyl-tRNA--protein transferase [Desulfohalovibrio reitneri]|uniref:leucyl/phenylalanyl-tRNA--protein transferase n=1 Tax=Desulfohalovibrio reitneri TaxID=1307759 RepID=UPI0004A6FC3C|nr:leucyl/phenylalanyl-tRNA--protein transferase [Desulfohalovibrio reitneri]